MMDTNENNITMDLVTFLKMRDESIGFNEILDIIFNSITELGWDGKTIRFNTEELTNYLKFAAPHRYKHALEELQKAKKE